MEKRALKREMYKLCMNPFSLLTTNYYGVDLRSSKAIIKISNAFSESIIDDSLDISPMFALCGITDDMIDNAFKIEDDVQKVLKLLDIVSLARKCTSEIYDQILITKASTSDFSKEIFAQFLGLPKSYKMSMISIIENELESHGISTVIITKFIDVVNPIVLNVQNIISEFIDDEEVDDMVDEKEVKEVSKDEAVKVEAAQSIVEMKEGKEMKEITKNNKSKKQNNKKEKSVKEARIKDGEIKLDAKAEMKAEIEDIKKQASTDIIMDGKEVKELIGAIDELDKEIFVKRYITPDELLSNTKKVLRAVLYTMNNIPRENIDLTKTIPCSSGKLKSLSTVFSDEALSKSYRVNTEIFRARFSSLIIEYVLENIDEYYKITRQKSDTSEMTDYDYAKNFTSMLCAAILAIMKGKYADGLVVISDMICVMTSDKRDDSDKYETIYNNGVIIMNEMTRLNKSLPDIFKMAYIMSTSKIKKFDIEGCRTNAEMIAELGKSIAECDTLGALYQMYIKSRPSVPTKIKDINQKDHERRAVLSLNFMSMMFGNRTVNRLIKACI